jgi:Fe2+ or Zn2+ uptake regulation protein
MTFTKNKPDPEFDIVSIYCECCEKVEEFDGDEFRDEFRDHAEKWGYDTSDAEDFANAERDFLCRMMQKNGHRHCR